MSKKGGISGAFNGFGPKAKKRKKGKGILSAYSTASKKSRKGKRGKDLAGYLDMGKSSSRKRRGGGFTKTVTASLARRLTRTERLVVQDAIDDELKNPESATSQYAISDQTPLPNNISFVRKLVRQVRERVGLWRSGK